MREIQHGDVTIFEDRPVVLPSVLAAAALVFAFGLTSHVDALLAGDKEAIGIALGLLLCGFGTVLLFRRDRFVFDPRSRRVSWRKWSLARSSSGELDFSEILDVTLESIGGSEGTSTYRLALRTPDGTVPLTETYAGGVERWRPTIDRIRAIIGLTGERPADADSEALVDQGRDIDAVRQLRETDGLDLVEAKARVDAARRRAD